VLLQRAALFVASAAVVALVGLLHCQRWRRVSVRGGEGFQLEEEKS
jgi:ribose/xylose/arabinose/galactoside ABC-type transport system permease subunit